MRQATNYQGSTIQFQIDKLRPKKEAKADDADTPDPDRDEEQEEAKPAPKVTGRKAAAKAVKEEPQKSDDDTPW
ncbi:hypothetical protein D3C76_1742150 [compost metagenome]